MPGENIRRASLPGATACRAVPAGSHAPQPHDSGTGHRRSSPAPLPVTAPDTRRADSTPPALFRRVPLWDRSAGSPAGTPKAVPGCRIRPAMYCRTAPPSAASPGKSLPAAAWHLPSGLPVHRVHGHSAAAHGRTYSVRPVPLPSHDRLSAVPEPLHQRHPDGWRCGCRKTFLFPETAVPPPTGQSDTPALLR